MRALNSVAWLQVKRGDLAGARSHLEEALNLDRRDAILVSNLAVVHLRMSNYRAAEELLRAHLNVDRNNQEAHYLLGESYYGQEKIAQAIDEWNAGLRLGSHPEMSRSLDKAQKELRVHDQLGELLSTHFILRYDRKVSDQQLGQQILTTLESLYGELTTGADVTASGNDRGDPVSGPDFLRHHTGAASWSGAIFDGKIRVPTKGLTRVTPHCEQPWSTNWPTPSSRHCLRTVPAWFNEGVAQLLEGDSAAPLRKMFAQLRQTDRLIPLRNLEESFSSLPEATAEIAYAEGLSAVEFLVKTHGKPSIRNILELMAQNNNFENAFNAVLKKSLREFESAWQQELTP